MKILGVLLGALVAIGLLAGGVWMHFQCEGGGGKAGLLILLGFIITLVAMSAATSETRKQRQRETTGESEAKEDHSGC